MTNNPTIDGVSRVSLQQVLEAYDYANSHPHKYLRGTTNWCAAVAHKLNEFQRGTDAPAVERQPVEFPAGAIHNGRAFIDQLESIYAFKEQQGHPLSLCSEWQELVRCFEWLANHATEAQSTIAQQAALIASLRSELSESYSIDTAPPAPVAVMLPDFDTWYAKNVGVIGTEAHKRDRKIWNACLDATAALNGPAK